MIVQSNLHHAHIRSVMLPPDPQQGCEGKL